SGVTIGPGVPERTLEEGDPWVGSCAEALRLGLVRRGNRLTLVPSLPEARESPGDALRAAAALITLRGFDAARDVIRGAVEYLGEGLAPEGFDPANGTPRHCDPAPALWL